MQSSDGSAASALLPTEGSERIVTLDILRGIALFGVLASNIWLWFSGVNFLFPAVLSELRRLSADSIVFVFISIFISGKAIRTFSFLFGLGFALQMMRAESRGQGVWLLYSRRLIVLLTFGIIHGVVFWYGDILAAYALLGFGLLLFRRATLRTLLVWAAVLIFAVPIASSSVPLIRSMAAASAAPPVSSASESLEDRNQRLLRLLAQTLLCLAIYYVGGLFGSFRPALGLLIAMIIFVAQIGFSTWWLGRYRFGPMEWLWRSLTYGRVQPMRIARPDPVPAVLS